MIFTDYYNSPIGGITMASDGESLCGLWFDGQKYFASTVKGETEDKSLPVFEKSKIVSMVTEAFFRVYPSALRAPVNYELFYLSNLSGIPSLNNLTPDAKGSCFEITSDEVKEAIKDNTIVKFTTQIRIDTEDNYQFFTRSDDGSILKINNQMVVNNDGDHGVTEKSGNITLKPGTYPLEVVWYNGGGDGWLDVFYKSNTAPKQILPTTIFALQ